MFSKNICGEKYVKGTIFFRICLGWIQTGEFSSKGLTPLSGRGPATCERKAMACMEAGDPRGPSPGLSSVPHYPLLHKQLNRCFMSSELVVIFVCPITTDLLTEIFCSTSSHTCQGCIFVAGTAARTVPYKIIPNPWLEWNDQWLCVW